MKVRKSKLAELANLHHLEEERGIIEEEKGFRKPLKAGLGKLLMEEISWWQKLRALWLKEGVGNTK